MRPARLLAPLFALALALPLAGCGDSNPTAPTSTVPTPTPTLATVATTTFAPALGIDLSAAGWTTTSSGLYYRTLGAADTSPVVANGRRVSVRYTGWLANGTQFDANSITFTLGAGQVIAGWDQGIVGMRVGERRQLLVPPTLGYGLRAVGPIPANSVLVFNVEVLSAT